MGEVIDFAVEKRKRDEEELDDLSAAVDAIIEDLDLTPQPYFMPSALGFGPTDITGMYIIDKQDAIDALVKIMIALDGMGEGDLADKISKVVGDEFK